MQKQEDALKNFTHSKIPKKITGFPLGFFTHRNREHYTIEGEREDGTSYIYKVTGILEGKLSDECVLKKAKPLPSSLLILVRRLLYSSIN